MHDENRFIWELAPVGIARVERSGRFLAINPRFCEIVGYSETEMLKRRYQEVTHPDDLDADVAEATNLADGDGHAYQMVKRYISKDGRTVWVSLYVNAVRSDGGEFTHYLVFAIELLHITLGNSNSSSTAAAVSGVKKSNLFDYVKENPKEALLIGTGLVAIAQGKNIAEVIREAFMK